MVSGVLLSTVILGIGLCVYLPIYGGQPHGDKIFNGEPGFLRETLPMIEHVFHPGEVGHRRAILQLGVLLLLLNPVVRVVFAGIGFAAQKDGLYVGVSLLVLAALTFGFFW
jgi:uncharacterized membrane protein